MKTTTSAILLAALASGSLQAGSLLVNFTAGLTPGTFSGPDNINPYVPGNALASFAFGQPDVLRADGQFYISDWDGSDGTFTADSSGTGNSFLLHSPILERLEAQTWRAEGASNHGTLTGLNDPISQRKKFLLPDDTLNGVATLVISGGQIDSLTYTLDFSNGAPGFENTALDGVTFDVISLLGGGSNFDTGTAYAVGSTDYLNTPYGLNTQLNMGGQSSGSTGAFPEGLLNGTVMDTTIGMLINEITANTDELGGSTSNISTDGRINGEPDGTGGDFYLQNIFAADTGTLTVFNSTSDLTLGVSAVPEPSSALLISGTLLLGLTRRKRA
ncbi:MAG: PEP-CTERM sorting domain-containing protein [Verrucomicrobiota bacterium]